MKHGALMHHPEDDVAVVVQDFTAGAQIKTVTLDGKEIGAIRAVEDIPLGHKIAVRDLAKGKEIIEYGRAIGRASQTISEGAHIHTQNLKSIRWGKS
jgi:(2R)-sulfolactate sulfo-lyase subunit alpha